jgi:hypothetical protein
MGPGLAVPEVAVVRLRRVFDRLEPAPERKSAKNGGPDPGRLEDRDPNRYFSPI